jgi:hypothetical protein
MSLITNCELAQAREPNPSKEEEKEKKKNKEGTYTLPTETRSRYTTYYTPDHTPRRHIPNW